MFLLNLGHVTLKLNIDTNTDIEQLGQPVYAFLLRVPGLICCTYAHQIVSAPVCKFPT